MKNLTVSIFLILFLFGFASLPCLSQMIDDAAHFVFPAEFERHKSVWLGYPSTPHHVEGYPLAPVTMQTIKELTPYVPVNLVVKNAKEKTQVSRLLRQRNIKLSRVRFYYYDDNDLWWRDFGPIFLRNRKGELKIADFNFNSWGYEGDGGVDENYSKPREKVDRFVAQTLNLPTIKTDVVSEGGAREVNGKGALMVVEAVELERNPGREKEELEAEYKRVLGQKKVIWLKKGLLEDQQPFKGVLPGKVFTSFPPGGHIDEFARFVAPDTILLAEITPEERDADPISRINYERMEENYRILAAATDQNGQPFKIIRVPAAEHLFVEVKAGDEYTLMRYADGTTVKKGEKLKTILSASYLNFFVTNGVVLMQTYWKKGRLPKIKEKDEKARKILQTVFPDRKIVGINAESLNTGGGGIHCITQQQPFTR